MGCARHSGREADDFSVLVLDKLITIGIDKGDRFLQVPGGAITPC